MSANYVQKSFAISKDGDFKAVSIRDSSSQGGSLLRKADLTNNAAQRVETSRPNNTGMPDNLKSGIESLSGFSMDDVRVHYNSSKPATVQALAYTQGTDIHVAPGQEKYLPHEARHVTLQMAGRVSPTTNINGMPVNDNAALEHEADVMGEKAVQCNESHRQILTSYEKNNVTQCMGQDEIEQKLCELIPDIKNKDVAKAYGGLCGGWSILMLRNPSKALEIWSLYESLVKESSSEIKKEKLVPFKNVVKDQLCLSHADDDDDDIRELIEMSGVDLTLSEDECEKINKMEKMPSVSALSDDESDASYEFAEKVLEKFVGLGVEGGAKYDDSTYGSLVKQSQPFIGRAGDLRNDEYF